MVESGRLGLQNRDSQSEDIWFGCPKRGASMERRGQWSAVARAMNAGLIGVGIVAGIAGLSTRTGLSQPIAGKQAGLQFVDVHGERLASLFTGAPIVPAALNSRDSLGAGDCRGKARSAAAQQSTDVLFVWREGRLAPDEEGDCSGCWLRESWATCGGDCAITLCGAGYVWGTGCKSTLQSCERGGQCWGASECSNEGCG